MKRIWTGLVFGAVALAAFLSFALQPVAQAEDCFTVRGVVSPIGRGAVAFLTSPNCSDGSNRWAAGSIVLISFTPGPKFWSQDCIDPAVAACWVALNNVGYCEILVTRNIICKANY